MQKSGSSGGWVGMSSVLPGQGISGALGVTWFACKNLVFHSAPRQYESPAPPLPTICTRAPLAHQNTTALWSGKRKLESHPKVCTTRIRKAEMHGTVAGRRCTELYEPYTIVLLHCLGIEIFAAPNPNSNPNANLTSENLTPKLRYAPATLNPKS